MSRRRRPGGRDPRLAGVDPETAAVRRWLTDCLRAVASRRVTPPGHAYGSPQEFVLKHGTWHISSRVAVMVESHCFANALNCALVYPGWSYVEGYAMGPLTQVPIHHGWGPWTSRGGRSS